MNRQRFLTINFIAFCAAFLPTVTSCFFSDMPPSKRILLNENATEAKILSRKFGVPSDTYDIEICTRNGYKIILHKVKWSLKNRGICISQINDIECCGGKIYELAGKNKIFYEPYDAEILGKMLSKDLKSVDDIIDNVEGLYGLYKIFEANSKKEFIYKEKFLVKACFMTANKYTLKRY